MSTTQSPRDPNLADEQHSRSERIEERLSRIEVKLERSNHEGRSAGRAFAIFAFFALLLACGNLIAVAAKLQAPPTTATNIVVRAPAKTGARQPSPAASRIAVNLREFSVQPSTTIGRAGRVTFAVRNTGSVPHEFVVLRTNKPAGDLQNGARADETGNVGETGDLQPGQAKTIRLDLKAGHYALICNLPGHYAAGQHTDFTVR